MEGHDGDNCNGLLSVLILEEVNHTTASQVLHQPLHRLICEHRFRYAKSPHIVVTVGAWVDISL
jgi:hypothetical protein